MAPARTVTIPVAVLARLEVTDGEITDAGQSADLGPFPDGTYVRVVTDDQLGLADQLRRLADEIDAQALDARLALHRPCPGGCDLLIDPDDDCCGRTSCIAELAAYERADRIEGARV